MFVQLEECPHQSSCFPVAGPSSSNLNPSFATGAIGHIPRTTATRSPLPLTSAHLSAHTRAVFTTLEGGRAPGPRTDYRSESTAAIRVSASAGPSINPSDAAPNLAVGEGGPGASGAAVPNGAGVAGAPNGGAPNANTTASADTPGRITKQDVNRITGMADYDGLGAMVWVYE